MRPEQFGGKVERSFVGAVPYVAKPAVEAVVQRGCVEIGPPAVVLDVVCLEIRLRPAQAGRGVEVQTGERAGGQLPAPEDAAAVIGGVAVAADEWWEKYSSARP
jgi:hypothetical protein